MHVQRKSGVRRNERVVGAGPLGDLMRTLSFVLSARKPVWALPPGKCWIIIMPFHETPLSREGLQRGSVGKEETVLGLGREQSEVNRSVKRLTRHRRPHTV